LLEGCPIVAPVTPPSHLLIATGPFGPRLSASAVAHAIARGIQEEGMAEPDICLLPGPSETVVNARATLDELDFDTRMRRARAVVIGAQRLEESTLADSVTFEIATRARQGGVPAYAVTTENHLDGFDARILDLQRILQARGARSLQTAGRELARIS
jgi:glycerate kinase